MAIDNKKLDVPYKIPIVGYIDEKRRVFVVTQGDCGTAPKNPATEAIEYENRHETLQKYKPDFLK